MDLDYKKYSATFFVFVVFYLSYLIIKPFFAAIIISSILSYIFYPLFKKFNTKFSANLSTLLTILIILLIFVIPLFFGINTLLNELPKAYMMFSKELQTSVFWNDVYIFLSESPLHIDLKNLFQIIVSSLLNHLKAFLFSIPEKIINITLTFFLIFFFIRDGEKLAKNILFFIPFNEKEKLILFRELKNMLDAIIYGQLITAIIQSLLATLVYYFLGFQGAIFFGFLTFFLAIIPMIGPSFVYVPLGLSSIINGLMINNNYEIIKGVILLIFGFAVISSVDNVIKPLVISDKVNIHPIVVLIGVLGGLFAFGVIGFIIGPIVLILLITIFKIRYMRDNIVGHFEHPSKENKDVEI